MTERNSLPQLVNERAAAEMLGLEVSTLRTWRVYGRGIAFYKMGRVVRYSVNDIAEFLAARRFENTAARDECAA